MQFHLNGFEPGDPEIADPAERVRPSGGRAGSGRGRCPDRRLRSGWPDARRAAGGVSRYQDLHRRAEAGPAAARAGRRHRLPHDGDVPGLRLRERVLKEACWINETTFWKPDDGKPRAASCAAAGCRTSRTACRNSRMSCSTRRGCTTSFSMSCATRRPARAALCAAPARPPHRPRPRDDHAVTVASSGSIRARGRGRDGQGALRRRLRRRAQHRAQVDRPGAARRFRQPCLGRDGRARRHRLSRHPLQVADPVGERRQPARHSARRRLSGASLCRARPSSTPTSASPIATSRSTT